MLDGPDGHRAPDGGEGAAGAARDTGGTMVVLAGASASQLCAAWMTPSGAVTPLSRPAAGTDGPPTDPVEDLAEALAGFVSGAVATPDRLWMIAPPDTEFSDHDEATALAALPAPTWMPLPVALAGGRLAARLYGPVRQRHHWAGTDDGRTAVVLDARGDRLTAWPIRRGPDGPSVVRGPLELLDRLDQLVGGVVKATLGPVAPAGGTTAAPHGGPAGPVAPLSRRDAALLRRGVRRARTALATTGAGEATVVVGEREAVVDRTVFEQLVAHTVTECLTRLEPDAGVELLVDADAPIAAVLARTTGAAVPPPAPPTPTDGVDIGDPVSSAAVEGATALLLAGGQHTALRPPSPPAPPAAASFAAPGPPRPSETSRDADPSAPPTAPVPVPGRDEEQGRDVSAPDAPDEEPAVVPEPASGAAAPAEPPRPEPPRPEPPRPESSRPEPSPQEPVAAGPAPVPAARSTAPESPERAGRAGRAWAVAVLAVVLLVVLVAAVGVLVLGPSPSGWGSGTGAITTSAPAPAP